MATFTEKVKALRDELRGARRDAQALGVPTIGRGDGGGDAGSTAAELRRIRNALESPMPGAHKLIGPS